MNAHAGRDGSTPHNLGLYRLLGFSGARKELLTLHEWLTGGDDLPAIAISGEQGNGKSTIATAAAWNHLHVFTDGIMRVSAAGTHPFRLYDVVRTMDTVLGTTLTRFSEERWGISILEQLYRRRRLLIIDKLAGATEAELNTLVEIIGHLHEAAGNSRILLIDRNFSPAIAGLVHDQHLHLEGLDRIEVDHFVERCAPAGVAARMNPYLDDLYRLTHGCPLPMRLILGLLLDFDWRELQPLLQQLAGADGSLRIQDLIIFAVENTANLQPQVGPLLNRLVSASGGASLAALRDLFWNGLGTPAELDAVTNGLVERALLDLDPYNRRVVMHPVVRRYLEQSSVLLGEEWDRVHAHYYLSFVEQYQYLPQERWPEVDVEWGNIYMAADWWAGRIQRLWQAEPLAVLEDPALDAGSVELSQVVLDHLDDLRLARSYALILAYYAFWRHPLGILRWLGAGALAAVALKDMSDYAWLLTNIGRQLFFTGHVQAAVRWLERAAALFDHQDMLNELAYVYTDLGTSLRILDRPRQALSYFDAALDCVVQTADLDALTTAYTNLSSAYYSLESYERALTEGRKALRIALRRHDYRSAAGVYNSMGLAMEAMEKLDEAERAYEHALRLFERISDVTGVSTCYNNLGSACYARSAYEQALGWYERDLALSEERGRWTDMAATLHNLGHVALEQRALERALTYFERSRDLYAAFDLVDYVAEEEEMIAFIAALRTEPSGSPRH